MANQPLAFAALAAGGLLITSAITGRSLGDVITGQVHTLTDSSGTVTVASDLHTIVNAHDGLVNPFANATGLTPGRIDMGQDFTMSPGSPIGALGDSRVIGIQPNWYHGQPFEWFQLLNEHGTSEPTKAAPYAGKYWYVAEQIIPTVHVGDVVKAGQPVATYAKSGTGIEAGLATASGATLAQSKGDVDPTSHYSAEGQQFADLLKALGL